MVTPIRDTRNKLFSTSALNISNSNMASVLNVNKIDDSVVNNIIYSGSDKNNEVRGHTLVPSANNSRSVLSSSSNKSEELYLDQMQRESDKIDQDEPVVISDSFQLEYTTLEKQNHNISKVVDTLPNMRNKHMQNAALTLINNTAENNNDVINIQLNYDIN